jgi:hypothetical protein
MKWKVVVGEDFDIEVSAAVVNSLGKEIDVGVANAQARLRFEQARGWIALAITSSVLLFTGGAGVLGLFEGSFEKLDLVWLVTGPFAGALAGYYFGGTKQ